MTSRRGMTLVISFCLDYTLLPITYNKKYIIWITLISNILSSVFDSVYEVI